jgi:predicted O-methyltransferase YrrM
MASAFVHFLKYFTGIDVAQTQTTPAERDSIKQFAAGRKRCVEIGVFEGVTTGTIASILESDAILYAIDPFIKGRTGICWGLPIAKREIAKHRPRCRIEVVRAFSPEANKQIEGNFDFVFVDGDHSLEGIQQDWRDWSGRITSDGIIGLHDTLVPKHNPNVANLGSHKYFIEHIQHDDRFEIVAQVDSLSMLRRK